MPVESATYVSQLVSANPSTTDPANQGDDHLRLIKAALTASFPNVAGAVSATDTQLSLVGKLISALQNNEWTSIGAVGPFTLTVPTWASRIEVRAVGGGGGGSNCAATSSAGFYSGAGGGAGGYVHGVYSVTPGATLTGYVGAAGGSQQTGGATSLSAGGTTLFTANGGGGAQFSGNAYQPACPGADGGTATGGNIVNERGGPGGDGQIGNTQLLGNGASSAFGGGGRAASQGNVTVASGNIPANAPSYGAGGGGAYDINFSGATYYGGGGGVGLFLYRFLL